MPRKRKITRAEADVQIAELAAAASKNGDARFEHELALGALVVQLQVVYEFCDGLEDDRPITRVIEEDFRVDYTRGVQFAQFYRVDQVLQKAKMDRLIRESYARVVAPRLDNVKLLKRIVRRGRAIAEVEGKGLTARHLKTARWELDPDCPASFAPPEDRRQQGDEGASVDIGVREETPQDLLAAVHTPAPVEGPWPYSPEAADAFAEVPSVDRDGVLKALAVAALTEEVTPDTVAEAAMVVRAERNEDGGRSGRPVVVGVAVGVVEMSRRKLLFDDHPEVIEDVDILDEPPEDPFEGGDYVPGPGSSRSPLLVVVPTGLCPGDLLDAHGARALVAGRAEVVVELEELASFGGPVLRGDDGEPIPDERGGPVLDIEAVREAAREAGIRKTFNPTGSLVGWARFTTNASTGCTHACGRRFCYASDIALRFYPQAFAPTVHPARLDAFANTPLPEPSPEWAPGWSRTVFYGSMTDVMNVAFPDWWVEAVVAEMAAHPQWNVFVLTKLAARLGDVEWPENVAVGVTVTKQGEVRAAAAGIAGVRGGAFRWVSAEPFLGAIDPTPLLDAGATFFAVGGQSATRWDVERQPEPAWVRALVGAVWVRGGHVYVKDNLDFRAHIPFASPDPSDGPAPTGVPAPDRSAVRPNGPGRAPRGPGQTAA